MDLWDDKETIYTDQTGAFLVTAQSGARYVMIMVTIYANTILVSQMENRSSQELINAYLELLKRAKATGFGCKEACTRQ